MADVAVSFTARAANRSEAGIRTVTVNAFGGSGQYEFFIMKRSRSTDLLDADGIAAAIAQDDSLSWKTSGTGTYIYVKQDYGWHQVAVRDLENPENLYTAMVRLRRPSSPAEVVPTTGDPPGKSRRISSGATRRRTSSSPPTTAWSFSRPAPWRRATASPTC